MPSAYESFGLVVLEALACGVPVVATPTGCVPDLIIDGVNGAVVDARAESVATGIMRVFSGDGDALADRARATAEEHSWSRVAQRYLDVLSEVHRADIDGSESRTAKGVRP
jgi:UDP-glucose:(heptosyl)LPS alpha-1,3-glucosyltransferase